MEAFFDFQETNFTTPAIDCSLPNKTSVVDYERFCKYFMSWFIPLVIIVGFLGNTISLSVLTKFKVFQATTSALFVSLAVADILNLIFAAGYLWFAVVVKIETMDVSPFFCYFTPYAEAIGYWLSPWLQATISVHRMLAVRFPLRVRQWLTLRRTRAMILLVTGLLSIYALIIPIKHRWNPRCFRCEKTEDEYTIYYSHGVFGAFIPLAVMLISTTIISVFVYNARNSIMRPFTHHRSGSMCSGTTNGYTTPPRVGERRKSSSSAGRCYAKNYQQTNRQDLIKYLGHHQQQQQMRRNGGGGYKQTARTAGNEKRVTLVLIMMNLTYFLTNGLAGVFLLLRVHLVDQNAWWLWHTFHKFFDVIACVNNSTNWAFYLMSGSQYRRKFLSALRLQHWRGDSRGHSTKFNISSTDETNRIILPPNQQATTPAATRMRATSTDILIDITTSL